MEHCTGGTVCIRVCYVYCTGGTNCIRVCYVYCTGGTVCIRVCYVYCTCVVIRYLGINKWARVWVRNIWTVGEFWQSYSPIPNWCCCNFFLPVISLYRYVTVPIFVHCWWFNKKWINPSCSCGEMTTLRITRTPKNVGRKFWVQSVFIFVLIINWF